MKKAKSLGPLFAAHAKYRAILKQHRNLRKDVAEYIASALPEGIALQWTQGTAFNDTSTRFELSSAMAFEEQEQVYRADEKPAHGVDRKAPGTEWRARKHAEDACYYLDDGAKHYKDEVRGFKKLQLKALITLWMNIPPDVLDSAYGDAVVRIHSDGSFKIEET